MGAKFLRKSIANGQMIYAQTVKNAVEIKTKEGEDGEIEKIIIRGFASTPTEDSYNDIVEPKAFAAGMDRFDKNPILLLQHNFEKPVGQVPVRTLSPKGLEIEGHVMHNVDDCFEKIQSGTLKGFSIGFRLLEWIEDVENPMKRTITKLELFEISIVSVPANPDTVFSMEKSLAKFFSEIKSEDVTTEEITVEDPKPAEWEGETPKEPTKTDGDETGGETPPADPASQGDGQGDSNADGADAQEKKVKSLIADATKTLTETLSKTTADLAVANEEKSALASQLAKAESEKEELQKKLNEANHLIDTTEIRKVKTVETPAEAMKLGYSKKW